MAANNNNNNNIRSMTVAGPAPVLENRTESYYCWATLGPSDRPHTLGEGRAGSLMTLEGRPDSRGRLVDPQKVAGWRLSPAKSCRPLLGARVEIPGSTDNLTTPSLLSLTSK